MKNLFRTLLPHKWTALLVLLLMAGQAYCEMNLPMFTQRLIDTGIQNRGIEHILPEAMTGSEYDALSSYMTEEQAAELEASYAADEDIMRRTVTDEDKLDELDELFLGPVTARYAELIGEKLQDNTDEDNQNLKAMGIQYAADCDEQAGLDMLAVQNRYMWHVGGLMMLMSLVVRPSRRAFRSSPQG